MQSECRVVPNLYRDSVTLMQMSTSIAELPGIAQAFIIMATPANLALLHSAGLGCHGLEAEPHDILIAVQGEDPDSLAQAVDHAERALKSTNKRMHTGDGPNRMHPRSIEMGLDETPEANLVLISTPGEYAAAEAQKALQLGLHAMIFSDNVALEDEIRIKRYAQDQNLLAMGPDCGTAIINGVPLGFANVVRRGNIGLVAASGTGLQQVTCLIDRMGAGISHAIGTGGRDLHVDVGGITMQAGIAMLASDSATDVIVLISKPAAPAVSQSVLAMAERSGKPVVVDFIGAGPPSGHTSLHYARTLAEAATLAVNLSGVEGSNQPELAASASHETWIREISPRFAPGQKYIRGLFSGGTFCYEASLLLAERLGDIFSNTAAQPEQLLDDVWQSRQHTLLDMGDDLFTRGRPHPMIDHRLRNARIVQEAEDPEVAVILLDIVLGYGSHPDPASEMAPFLRQAHEIALRGGRELALIGWLCGAPGDPQQLDHQEAVLTAAGVQLADSSTAAVLLAADIAQRLAPSSSSLERKTNHD